MQTAVIATADLSDCSSVRPSVPEFVQTNEDTILRSTVSGRTIILVSGELKSFRYSQEVTPSEGLRLKRPPVASENLTKN